MDERMYVGRILELDKKSAKIDSTDRKIIYALSADARAPLATLARELHTSRDIVNYRIKRLLTQKIILQCAPSIDFTFFGYSTYHVFFITNNHNKDQRDNFIHALINNPHTRSVMEYTTKWEIEWVVVASSLQEFDNLLTKISTEFAHVIIEKNSVEIIKGFKSITLPERPEYNLSTDNRKKKKKQYVPDKIDIQILQLLCLNCRTPSYELASHLKISATTVRYRTKQMFASGIIRRFSILVDLTALDYHLYAVGAIVKSLNQENERKLLSIVENNRFIIRTVKVLGHWDLIFSIVADTIQHFHKTVKSITDGFGDILVNYESLIAYKEHMFHFFPPIIATSEIERLQQKPQDHRQ